MWPALENKLLGDEVEQVIGLLTNYADAKVSKDEATKVNRTTSSWNWDAYRAAGAEWRKCDIAHSGARTQLLVGLHGVKEYARVMGYNTVN